MDEVEWREQPDAGDIQLLEVLKALSDPARLHILAVLADGDFHNCGVEDYGLDIHKSTLSHHLKVLREAGVTRTRVVGRSYQTQLRREELDDRFPGLVASLAGAVQR